ncbi:hypothetical protein ACHWQZ_G016964 [Mnemiopsis leidyi]
MSGAVSLSVASMIVDSLTDTTTTVTNLTQAEEQVRGLTFDKFEEKFLSQVMEGINLYDFEKVVERLANRHSLPADKKEEILDGQYAAKNYLVSKEFVFNVGQDSQLVYMKVATIKTSDSKIDLALMYYRLDFKLAPMKIETRRKKRFLGIKTGTRTSIHYEPRNLSEKDQDCFTNFFRYKALKGFLLENPAAGNQLTQGL